jgi:hypothetical protein
VGWTTGFRSQQGQGLFVFVTESRPDLGPTQSPTQRLLGPHSPSIKRPGHEAEHSPTSCVPRLRMREAVPSHPQYVFMAWYLVKHRDVFTFMYLVKDLKTPMMSWPYCSEIH